MGGWITTSWRFWPSTTRPTTRVPTATPVVCSLRTRACKCARRWPWWANRSISKHWRTNSRIRSAPWTCTEIGADRLDSVYLDPWHRQKLGWVFRYAPGGTSYELGDETWADDFGNKSRPAVFYNDANQHEYYLFEYRAPRSYDKSVASAGIVAWHVLEDQNGNPADQTQGHVIYAYSPISGATDVSVGGSVAWTPQDGRFQVQWKDGTYLPRSFWVEQPQHSANSLILHWDGAPSTNAPPVVTILQP